MANLARNYRIVPVPQGRDSFFESLSVALKTVGLNVTPFDARMGTVASLNFNWSPQNNPTILRFNNSNRQLEESSRVITNLNEYKRIMGTPKTQPGDREFKAASRAYRVNIKFVGPNFGFWTQHTQTYPGQARGTIYIQMDKLPMQGEQIHFQPLVPIPLLNKVKLPQVKLPQVNMPSMPQVKMPQVKLPSWPQGFGQKDVAATVAAAIANAKTALPKVSTKREPPAGFRIAGFLSYLGKPTSVPLYQKENSNVNSQKAARLKSTGQLVTGWAGWKIVGDDLVWKGGKVEVNTNEVAAAIAAAASKIPGVAEQVKIKKPGVAAVFASKFKNTSGKRLNVVGAIRDALATVTSKKTAPPPASNASGARVLKNAKVDVNSIARAINSARPRVAKSVSFSFWGRKPQAPPTGEEPPTKNVASGATFPRIERLRTQFAIALAERAKARANAKEAANAKAAANAQAKAQARANRAKQKAANAEARAKARREDKEAQIAAKQAAKEAANAEAAAKAAAKAAAEAKAKANRNAAEAKARANRNAAIAKARANANAKRQKKAEAEAKLEELKKKQKELRNSGNTEGANALNAEIAAAQQAANNAGRESQNANAALNAAQQPPAPPPPLEPQNEEANFNINGLNTNTNNSSVIQRLAMLFAQQLTIDQETMLLRILDARLTRIFSSNVNWGNRGNVTGVKAKLLAYQNGLAGAIRSRPRVKQLIGRYVAQFKSFTKNVTGGGSGGFINFGSAISYGNSLERRARYAGGPEYFGRPGGGGPQYFPRNNGRPGQIPGTTNRGTSAYPFLHPEDPRAKVISGLSANERKVVSSAKDAEIVNKIIQGAGGPEKVKKAVEVLKYYPKNTAVKMGLVTPTVANAVNKLGGPNRANVAVSINRKIQTAVKRKKSRVTKKKAPPAHKPPVRARLLKALVKKFTKNEIVRIAGENALGSKNNKTKNNLVRNFTKYVRRQPKKKSGSVTKGSSPTKKK